MAIQQTKKQSDLEKRLKLLHRQIYGKNSENSDNQTLRYTDTPISSDTPSHSDPTESGSKSMQVDIAYLHQDLLKILLLAGSAIGLQIILFALLQNHVLNLNFF